MATPIHEWDPFFGPPVRAGGPVPSWTKGCAVNFRSNQNSVAASIVSPTPVAANMIQPRAAWQDEREMQHRQPPTAAHGHSTYATVHPTSGGAPAYQPAQYHQQQPTAAAYNNHNYPPPVYHQGYQQPSAHQPELHHEGLPSEGLREQRSTNSDAGSLRTMTVS